MLGITPGALRLPLCYVQISASGWFVGEGGGLGAGRPTIFMEDVRWLTGRRKRRPLQLQFFLKFLLDNRSMSCYIVSVS